MNKKSVKFLLWAMSLLLTILITTVLLIHHNTYEPTIEALGEANNAHIENKTLFFKGDPDKPAILFFQGALVENASYSIWAKKVSDAGYPVYLIKEPLNLAIINPNKAKKIIQKNKIENYVIGGHSLGGVIASRFASEKNDPNLKGVFFLASYPDKNGNLDSFTGEVLSVVGSNDNILNMKSYTEAIKYLPSQTEYKTIQGGNHGGFGSYGEQKKDKKALISNDTQQTQISNIIINWMDNVNSH